jgi:hypothetical protein
MNAAAWDPMDPDMSLIEAAEHRARRGLAAGEVGSPQPSAPDGWPVLASEAFHGPIGDYVLQTAPHTEADPAAVLVQLLVGVGVLANSGPHVLAGNDPHPASLFAVIVGDTSRAKKGTAWSAARIVLARIDPAWAGERILGGFGSGEIVIETLAGLRNGDDDTGPRDTRMLIQEGEWASVLKVSARDGSTLGQTIRNAWDGKPLAARTRGKGTVVATDYHLGAIGHITVEELRRTLHDSDTYGGTVNRSIWVAARRSKRLPEGGNVPDTLADQAARTLAANLTAARRHGRYERTQAARALWADIYHELADDSPAGLLGAAIARSEAQCLRLSLAYAIADGADTIDVEHLEAAHALWRYCRATAAMIFPPSTTLADQILAALQDSGSEGITGTTLHALSGRNASAAALQAAVAELVSQELVETVTAPNPSGRGRPRTIIRLRNLPPPGASA